MLSKEPIRNPEPGETRPHWEERCICLKPTEQEIQGINTLSVLNHHPLRNDSTRTSF